MVQRDPHGTSTTFIIDEKKDYQKLSQKLLEEENKR
jgi:hypothetical protein